MKTLMQKIEDIMVAITFAEAGEFDASIRMMDEEAVSANRDNELDTTLEAA